MTNLEQLKTLSDYSPSELEVFERLSKLELSRETTVEPEVLKAGLTWDQYREYTNALYQSKLAAMRSESTRPLKLVTPEALKAMGDYQAKHFPQTPAAKTPAQVPQT